jgi:hypothetical protein
MEKCGRREFIRRVLAAGGALALGIERKSASGAEREQSFLLARAVTRGPKHHFFGYYDKHQWDATGRYLLCQEVSFMDRPPRADDEITVGMVDLKEGDGWHPIAQTKAWCWQQGTMLQWLGSAPDQLIIHNNREGDHFVAVVRDIRTGNARKLPRAIYAVSPDGKQAVCLNFARVQRTRPGYGYAGAPDPWEKESHPEKDGVFWMDLETGENKLVISLAQIAAHKPNETMDGSEHWFNHLLFSPDGSRFIFLHRWRKPNRGWWTRMFTARPDGTEVHLIADHELVSHFIWRDPTHILAWSREPRLGRGERFHLYTDGTDEVKVIGEGILTTDGHCSYSPDKRWILTDTYPDKERFRTLILYNVEDDRRVDIGRFYAPKELDGEIRCDLHPRWTRDGKTVSIDSVHEGSRQVYVLDVTPVVG